MWCATREPMPGFEAKEGLHAIAVARQDDDEVVALGLHDLQQDLDRLLAVVALVLGAVEVVRLVDEEHAAAGALEHLPGLRRRVADVLADEVVARDGHDLRLLDVAEPVQDLGHAQRDGRLPRAGVAGEAHVQRRTRAGQALLAAQAIDDQQRRDLADARLHRLQRDEVGIELREHALDVVARRGASADGRAHARRPPLRRGRARRAVAAARGGVGRVGVDRVADLAVGLLLALDREARLDRRAPDDEGQRRGLPPERAVVADHLHVAVRPRLARPADLAHDDVDVVLDEVELRRRPHLPQRVARVRVVGVLDHDRPALAQGVAQLGLDLGVGEVGQVGERSLGDAHGAPPSSGWA